MEHVLAPVIKGTNCVIPLDEKSFFTPIPVGARFEKFPKNTIEHVYAMLNDQFIKMPEKDKIEAEGTVAARKQLDQLIYCSRGVGRLICVVGNKV